jgi:hypothetical protein
LPSQEYYAVLCLEEMVTLETDILILVYVSYSNENTMFHKVHFDTTWKEATELYIQCTIKDIYNKAYQK